MKLWLYRWVSSEQLQEMVFLGWWHSVSGGLYSCTMHNVSVRHDLWWGICGVDAEDVTIYAIHSGSFLLRRLHRLTVCNSFRHIALNRKTNRQSSTTWLKLSPCKQPLTSTCWHQGHKLLLFSGMLYRRIPLPPSAGRLLQPNQPERKRIVLVLLFFYLITAALWQSQTRTPLLLDVIATTGDHWLVLGLYRSALLSSVVSSLPPTE